MKESELSILELAKKAKAASVKISFMDEKTKNSALKKIAQAIDDNRASILEQNRKDIEFSEELLKKGEMTKALIGRLKLDDEKINVIIKGINDVMSLEDPSNRVLWAKELDKGLELYRVSCPIGVLGIIFESRPDVVPQIVSLAVKSGNVVILKGGKEAINTNTILVDIINRTLQATDTFPSNVVNLINTREDVGKMLELDEYIDLIIPRGSNDLVKYIKSNTRIPVLGHADGICHVYIDESADIDKAVRISVDSKIQYPSACNAVETILINKRISEKVLPQLVTELDKNRVVIRADDATINVVSKTNRDIKIEKATEKDWSTEYSDMIVSVKIVDDLNSAIEHINSYGSGHTDCIVTEDREHAGLFMNMIDSAGVYHNASTRFADGFRYGLGAEVGISTNRIHARGPVGLEGLVTYKYKLYGSGQIVAEYSGKNAKKFTHKNI
ncbi:MAG: glutamate-5-semialdehyde dehydrogenase [Oligoflexia bacterium]|nr:glutamate-5-semialdehyde dehydrogenase [Oligoflexia bacterium]